MRWRRLLVPCLVGGAISVCGCEVRNDGTSPWKFGDESGGDAATAVDATDSPVDGGLQDGTQAGLEACTYSSGAVASQRYGAIGRVGRRGCLAGAEKQGAGATAVGCDSPNTFVIDA